LAARCIVVVLVSNRGKKQGGSDSKFFTTNRKGENHELREELRSPHRDRKRDAVKKVIANMTVGKDVSTLFTDVINCIQTGKKLLLCNKLFYYYVIVARSTMCLTLRIMWTYLFFFSSLPAPPSHTQTISS
jgi:hypothetical protein